MDPPHLDRSFVRLQKLPLLQNLGLISKDASRVVRDDQLPSDSLKLEDYSQQCKGRGCMESRQLSSR